VADFIDHGGAEGLAVLPFLEALAQQPHEFAFAVVADCAGEAFLHSAEVHAQFEHDAGCGAEVLVDPQNVVGSYCMRDSLVLLVVVDLRQLEELTLHPGPVLVPHELHRLELVLDGPVPLDRRPQLLA
jgi:hypothetical protein